jgi:NAD(P)-dependent dehydrogenase (short-subunit alcohol dehydrogenase family)
MANDVVVVIGAGGIGVAIARRQGFGRTILLADFDEPTLQAAAEALKSASYTVSTQSVDVSSRKSVQSLASAAAALGTVVQVVNTAGLSPNMAPPSVCWRSIFTAPPWSSRNSSGSSRQVGQDSSSRAWRVT